MSIDEGAQVTIILLEFGPCEVIVNYLGQVLYLGRAPCTKETLPDFRECRVGYPTSTSIPRVDRLSTDIPVLGRHKIPYFLDHFLYYCERGECSSDLLIRIFGLSSWLLLHPL